MMTDESLVSHSAGPQPGNAVAVLGTGIMGSAMTRNLVAAGLHTIVWDRSREATQPLAEAGAWVATSPREAVRDAGVVITMLPTAEAVDSVVFANGVVQAFADGAVLAQMARSASRRQLRSASASASSGPM